MAVVATPPPTDSNSLSRQEVAELSEIMGRLAGKGVSIDDIEKFADGPKTDDELWEAVWQLTGYKIPRVAVCTEHGHVAPFQIFADVYFCRRLDVLMIGNRGGGKTTISGFLHGAKCKWNPHYKSTIVGATDKQAGRGYAEFKRFIRTLHGEILNTLQSKTEWWNLSFVEVLIGTLKQMNGPHPHLAQFDELELSTRQIFEEFQNMAQGDELYPSQNLLSSTRKFVFGLIQEVVKRADEDVRNGDPPEWDVMIFCVFETMQETPNCQMIPKKERDKRLKQLGLPCDTCKCHEIKKGIWDDGSDRTFNQVCAGRAFRSRGFMRVEDVWRRFKRLSRETWEAQQECLRPDPQGLVHKWVKDHYILPAWHPYPQYGAVYRSWDWGGSNPHSVHFHQVLDVPVTLRLDMGQLFNGEPNGVIFEQRFKEGDIVTFDEIYYEGGSYRELGRRVMSRQAQWAEYGFKFRARGDVADPAGRTAKEDVNEYCNDNGIPAPKWAGRSPDRVESVKKHKEWGEDGRLFIVGRMCPWMLEEYSTYHYPPTPDGKNASEDPVKEDDHAMDETRLFIWWLYKGGQEDMAGTEIPASHERGSGTQPIHKQSGFRNILGVQRDNEGTGGPVGTKYLDGSPVSASVRRSDYPTTRR